MRRFPGRAGPGTARGGMAGPGTARGGMAGGGGARRAVAVLLALAFVAGAGCGVPEDSEPKALAPESVPFDLLAPNVAGQVPGPREGMLASIYLVDGEDRLVDVQRRVPPPGGLAERLTSLLEPPTMAEANAGLRSTIPDSTHVNEVSEPVDGVVTVDLTGPLAAGAGQRLALAQIVFTATAVRRPRQRACSSTSTACSRRSPTAPAPSRAAPRTREDYLELLAPQE